MKKIIRNFFVLALLTLSTASYGQISKGTKLIGGSVTGAFRSESLPDNFDVTNGSLALNPNFGYFISDKIALGASANLSFSFGNLTNNDQLENEFTSFTSGLAPFVRYYLISGLFAELKGGLESISINQTSFYNIPDSQQESYSVLSYTFEPGIGYNYFLNDIAALEGKLSYRLEDQSTSGLSMDQKSSRNTLQFSVGLQVFLRSK